MTTPDLAVSDDRVYLARVPFVALISKPTLYLRVAF
jgi:hypothetical protein